jgi:hypothetical protein
MRLSPRGEIRFTRNACLGSFGDKIAAARHRPTVDSPTSTFRRKLCRRERSQKHEATLSFPRGLPSTLIGEPILLQFLGQEDQRLDRGVRFPVFLFTQGRSGVFQDGLQLTPVQVHPLDPAGVRSCTLS